ncbi:hypothetical protein GDO81_007264 [Engystomops pustulosus]|uniref:Alpha 1,4-glycosyltransferase domain-containing protein n=1 Tax=Engystomops pustulosus TaxID=76066 RepID=A0AAV7C5S8_ENGPU|nr:hypothetical protein GDO81_007264 [Engystomops pustulosus]
MLTSIKIASFLLLLTTLGFFYGIIPRENILAFMSLKTLNMSTTPTVNTTVNSPFDVLKAGNSIFFVESTDRMKLPALVLCAVESAARVYKDRPVAFFLKGLSDTNTEELVKKHFPTLTPQSNIYFFPLKFEELFNNTPLHSWFSKINTQQQSFWTHVSSDGCRLVLVWKYGGVYMDTDVISIRIIPKQDFLAAESATYSSNGVFGFTRGHDFTQKCMEDFVQNYNSKIWGQQGPLLLTRVAKRLYSVPHFSEKEDIMCGNVTVFNPDRFYPVPCGEWRKYYQVWDKLPTFDNSYALHLWNSMNREKISLVPGSNVLADHLFKEYCPSTYEAILRKEITYH